MRLATAALFVALRAYLAQDVRGSGGRIRARHGLGNSFLNVKGESVNIPYDSNSLEQNDRPALALSEWQVWGDPDGIEATKFEEFGCAADVDPSDTQELPSSETNVELSRRGRDDARQGIWRGACPKEAGSP